MTLVSTQRRFRVSIRTLMIVVALCALLLAPVIWRYRAIQAILMQEKLAAESARAQAEKAMSFAQLRAAEARLAAAKAMVAGAPDLESAANGQGALWAALSANHSVFKQSQAKDLNIEFTLMNDGEQVIEPKIAESRIVINGQELADSGSILGSGPKDAGFKALAPGDHLRLSFALGDHLNKPGTYRVSWKGGGFQSPEIVVRVLAEKTH
jgi:hypothetical protein